MGLTYFIAFIEYWREEFWKDSLLNNTKKERLWLIENIYIAEYQTNMLLTVFKTFCFTNRRI